MSITLHKGDIPDTFTAHDYLAVDTETMGLLPRKDRLCVVQLSNGDGTAHLVQFDKGQYDAPNLKKLLMREDLVKIFHYARFDIAVLKAYLGIDCTPVYCTKIASRLARSYTDKHSLRECCRELLGVELNKQQQSSDWGAAELSRDQQAYAANDVLYLHALQEKLEGMLVREKRDHLARACFEFLPTRAELDLGGLTDLDIFAH